MRCIDGRHAGISVGVLTQQIPNVAKPFRENVASIVIFYSPSAKTTEAIFEDYAGGLSPEEYKKQMTELEKRTKFSYPVFVLPSSYGIKLPDSKLRT